MKKTSILMLLLPVLTLVCLFSACNSENNVISNITFENNVIVIEKYYYVGDEIKLNGQNINYHADIKDATPTESNIAVTKGMISNFSTQQAGEFSLKLTYKNASIAMSYYVYEKPDISTSFGYYTCTLLGRNIIAEIKQNQVVINFYDKDFPDMTTDTPTSTKSINTTLKSNNGGSPSICFVYENSNYEFCKFANGKFTNVKQSILNNEQYSSIESLCTKIG